MEFGRRLKRLLEDTDINCTLHQLRHTHASLMIENGVDINVVQERLGHSTSRTTRDIYVHVSPTMQKEAVDVFENSISGS